MTNRNTLVSIITAAAIAALASPAFADEAIPLDSYDLTRVEQVNRLHTDIVVSAARQCKKEFRRWTYGSKFRRIDKCTEATVDHAVSRVGNARLSEMHASMDMQERYDARLGLASQESSSGH